MRDEQTGRLRRTDPWATGFVDLATGQGLLGQMPGRTSADVRRWLTARAPEFRAAIRVVALDPSAPYAYAVRQALPHAAIAVDHFHLVALANQAVTRVRQRVTRSRLGRTAGPARVNRRLLLRGRERLSARAFARMWNGAIDGDPPVSCSRRGSPRRSCGSCWPPRPTAGSGTTSRTGCSASTPGAPR